MRGCGRRGSGQACGTPPGRRIFRPPTARPHPWSAGAAASGATRREKWHQSGATSGHGFSCGQGAMICAPAAISRSRAARMRDQPAGVPGSTISSSPGCQRPQPVDQRPDCGGRKLVEHIGQRHEVGRLGVGQRSACASPASQSAAGSAASAASACPAFRTASLASTIVAFSMRVPAVGGGPQHGARAGADVEQALWREIRRRLGDDGSYWRAPPHRSRAGAPRDRP